MMMILIQNHLVLVMSQPAILLSRHVFYKGNSFAHRAELVSTSHLGICFNWLDRQRLKLKTVRDLGKAHLEYMYN